MTCLSVRTRSVGSITSVDSYKKREKKERKKRRKISALAERLGRRPVPVIDIFTLTLIGGPIVAGVLLRY